MSLRLPLREREIPLPGAAGGGLRTGTLLLAGLFAVYVVGGLFVLAHHEPWRDEAQAWLIARDLPFRPMLFEQMGHEGTPALWHLLNGLLIALGLPYESQGYLNFAFAAGAVGLILWRAPFPPLVKALFAFSYYLAFEYSHIARNFALGALLLTAVLALFGQRHRRPLLYAALVALMANANVFTFLMALAFGLIHAVEAWRDGRVRAALPGAAVMAAAGLLAFVQMIPAADNFRTGGALGMANMMAPGNAVQAGFELFYGHFDYKLRELAQRWPAMRLLFLPLGALVVAFWALFLLRIRSSWAALLFFAVVAGGILSIMVFKKEGSPRVHGHLLLAAMGALWLQALLGRPPAALRLPWGGVVPAARLGLAFTVALTAGLGLSVLRTGWHWAKEVRTPFSGAREMAAHLRANGLDRHPIVAYESAWGSAVLPYLDRDALFYYPDLERHGSYLVWTRAWWERHQDLSLDAILRSAEAGIGTLDGVLFLMSRPFDDPRLEPLHAVAEGVERETFHLYRLRGGAPP